MRVNLFILSDTMCEVYSSNEYHINIMTTCGEAVILLYHQLMRRTNHNYEHLHLSMLILWQLNLAVAHCSIDRTENRKPSFATCSRTSCDFALVIWLKRNTVLISLPSTFYDVWLQIVINFTKRMFISWSR